MIVKIVYELDIDTTDFDPKFIDVCGMAKDLSKLEMKSLLDNKHLEAEDFTYVIETEDE